MSRTSTTSPRAALAVAVVALGVDMYLYGSLVPLLPRIPAVAGSPTSSGVLMGSYALAMLLATPLVGRWVDRRGPRGPLLFGLVLLVLATLLFATLLDLSGTRGLIILALARVIQGTAAAASWTASLALLAATHPVESRGRVMGMALSAVGFGILLGPAVSGFLADHFTVQTPFLVVGALAAGDAAARIVLIKDVPQHVSGATYRQLAAHRTFPLLVALTVVGATALTAAEPILPLHFAQAGLGSTGIGLAFGAAALVGSLAAPLAGAVSDRFVPSRIAAAGAALVAVGFALCGVASLPISIGGLVLVAFSAQLVLAPTLILIGELAESRTPAAFGSAYALYNLAYTAGLTVAPLAVGPLTGATTVRFATVVLALASLLIAALLVLKTRGADRHGNVTATQPR